jgi:predicted transglutaminase-like cysteine proteinase
MGIDMMCPRLAVAVAALLVAAGAAHAAPVDSGEKAAQPVREKKICRRQEVTGSMFPKLTCHTAAEWAQIDAANQQGVERMRNTPLQPGRDS